jgi:septal ring factor EnvC (AmiA/AmiB activator)
LRVSFNPFTLSFPIELRTVTGQVVEKKSELQEVLASITAANLEQQTLGQSIGAAQSQLTALRTQLDGYEEKKIQLERQLAALGNLEFPAAIHMCVCVLISAYQS